MRTKLKSSVIALRLCLVNSISFGFGLTHDIYLSPLYRVCLAKMEKPALLDPLDLLYVSPSDSI